MAGTSRRLSILVLGGTRFVGRAFVEAALADDHRVTLFHRGQTNPGLFGAAETVLGDRTGDLFALTGRRFDVVVDVAGYDPQVVRRSVDALQNQVGRYVYLSSVSVLADQSTAQNEDGDLLVLDDNTAPEKTYGARKAACERLVQDAFGARALLVRPGMIVGPHDPTDRFAYWPRRFARGGRILLPGDPSDLAQFIDVRDLADWILRSVTSGLGGVFNVTGRPLPFGAFFDACQALVSTPAPAAAPAAPPAILAPPATVVWVSSERLIAAGVDPWMGVPLWIAAPGCEAVNRIDVSRATAAGLTTRPLARTLADTLAWDTARGGPPDGHEGLTEQEEHRLLGTPAVPGRGPRSQQVGQAAHGEHG
ncbi:NAD-dependent epimerase/dehydratase family protein [Frankia sp. AiPs1]|uniref:NAD-dependent epimerase/dehydratase family protein n=1 Tax=Frankia sp. AiPs1 TaxID=573493 RepID=UPI002044C82D|nr:NAD-dependent epimerase/dehydratase family protein [Frankia sp. AiPs1]MCM3920408.1 NAD-dependent epimerase/dehydratase family protein [Frankia sp. AiPs1]